MRELVDSGETRFRLLRYFTIGSLIAFVVVAALLGYVFRRLAVDGLLSGYENEHINHARIIANQLWERDLTPLLRSSSDKLATELQTDVVHGKVLTLLAGTKVFKIKVYDLDGKTVYSTELKQIGEDKSKNAGVIAALQGRSSSELAHRDTFSSFEGEVQDRDLVETYVPRYDPNTRKVSGVFEIYGDATALVAEIDRRQRIVVGAVVALLSLLYVVLWIMVKRAQDQITEHSRQRRKAQQALALAEQRWQFALEGSETGVWDHDLVSGEVIYSKRYKEIFGYEDDAVLDGESGWEDRVHPDDLARVRADREEYLAGQSQTYANERRMRCRDGSWKWILSRGMVVARDAQGHPLRLIGTHADFTQRHEREEALRLASTVILTVDEAVMVCDLEEKIVSVNPAFTVITGFSDTEVVGKTPRVLASGAHGTEFYREMWARLGTEGSWSGEIRNRRKNGKLYVEWLSIKQVRNDKDKPSHYVAVFSDISDRKADEERMQHLAHFDALTGLPNRALFSDRLHQAVAKARRDSTRMALMFLDLDKFKPVNDEHGHHIGDMLLKEVATRMLECVRRDTDTVARLGGDEFVVILSNIEKIQQATMVAEKIRHALNRSFELAGLTLKISSCTGVAVYPEHGGDANVLLKSADAAMYRAKEGGRDRVEIATAVASLT